MVCWYINRRYTAIFDVILRPRFAGVIAAARRTELTEITMNLLNSLRVPGTHRGTLLTAATGDLIVFIDALPVNNCRLSGIGTSRA